MKAEEIREMMIRNGLLNPPKTDGGTTKVTAGFESAVAMFEIAAQLAELNQTLRDSGLGVGADGKPNGGAIPVTLWEGEIIRVAVRQD